MARRLLALLAALTALTGLTATDSLAASSTNPGLLGISPPRRVEIARPPLRLEPTLVQNTTRITFDVTITPGILVQRLDGTYDIDRSPRSLRAAQIMLDVGPPTKFTLVPNRQIKLPFKWVTLPRGARAAYLGLLVTGVPRAGKATAVSTVLRILGTNFFQLPGPYVSSGHITSVRGEQAAPRQLRFITRVKNTGQVADGPRSGHTIIEDSSGKHLVTLKWDPGAILPGYEREFPVLLKKVLPAGHYVAVSAMRFGKPAKISTKRYPFTLTGPNLLPTPNLKLTKVTLGGHIGDPAKVSVSVKDNGTKKTAAVLRVELFRTPSIGAQEKKVTSSRKALGTLEPGKDADATFELGELQPGIYRAHVIASDGKTAYDEADVTLQPEKAKSFITQVWNWVKDHLPWLLLGLAALVILFLLLRRRRRDDEEEDEEVGPALPATAAVAPTPATAAPTPAPAPPAPTPAPPASTPPAQAPPTPAPAPPAAPAPTGPVDINSAGVDELMTLPGVGRRAAERLIAHRESNGPFASLDDLRAVEGFHGERISRIADHVRIS